MNILVLLVPLAILIALFFLAGFLWASENDQFEDLEGPAHRILGEEYSNKNRSQSYRPSREV